MRRLWWVASWPPLEGKEYNLVRLSVSRSGHLRVDCGGSIHNAEAQAKVALRAGGSVLEIRRSRSDEERAKDACEVLPLASEQSMQAGFNAYQLVMKTSQAEQGTNEFLEDLSRSLEEVRAAERAPLQAEIGRLRELVESAFIEGWTIASHKDVDCSHEQLGDWESSNTAVQLSKDGKCL